MTADVAAGRPKRRGRPRKSEAQDTKAALLQAAVTLFAENGYAGTSIRAIARAVGMSESVLYAHYGSKQEIFDAATEVLGPKGVIAAMADVDAEIGDGDPARYLREVCEHTIRMWDTEQARSWLSLLTREGLVHERFLSTAIEENIEVMGRHVRTWLDAGLCRPGLGSPIDVVFAFLAPLAMARVRGLHASATPEERAATRERMRHHTEFFIRAVVSPREG